jgi:hypothetical protein
MEVSGHLHAPASLPPRKEPLVPIGKEAGWAPEPFWTRWWREKFPALAGNRTLEPHRPARSAALHRLSYHDSSSSSSSSCSSSSSSSSSNGTTTTTSSFTVISGASSSTGW